jgi:hypothetical protein
VLGLFDWLKILVSLLFASPCVRLHLWLILAVEAFVDLQCLGDSGANLTHFLKAALCF